MDREDRWIRGPKVGCEKEKAVLAARGPGILQHYWKEFYVRLPRLLEGVADFVERKWLWGLIVFSVAYWAVTWKIAVIKPLWNDEIFTHYLTILPTWRELWSALLEGTDQQTPLFYLVTRFAGAAGTPIGLRLPAMVGIWTSAICLFFFTARRTSRVCGMIAMLMPLVLYSSGYAYEARPYGLLLGSASAMLLSWQLAADGFHRKAAIALWATAALTVSIHYLGALALVPIGIGELIRWWVNRKPDLPVWAALAGAVPPFFLALPLVRGGQLNVGRFWTIPQPLGSISFFYQDLLSPATPVAALLLAVALMGITLHYNGAAVREGEWVRRSFVDTAVVAGFIALPVLYLLVGLKLGAFVPRYAIVAVLGVSVGFPFLIAKQRKFAVFVLFVVSAQFAVHEARKLREAKVSSQFRLAPDVAKTMLPIVVSGPRNYIEKQYYAQPQLASRLYYIAEPPLARQYANTGSADIGCLRLAHWAPLQVKSYAAFLAQHRQFFVVSQQGEEPSWIVKKLQDDGARITIDDIRDDQTIYDVTTRELGTNSE